MQPPPREPEGPGEVREALLRLSDLPDVGEAVEAARLACDRLRFHEALRRRIPQAAAESRVRGAVGSALLEGVEVAGSQGSLAVVRDLMRGARPWPEPVDPQHAWLAGAVRCTALTETVTAADLRRAAQLLSRLHVAAAAELLPPERLGRPRTPSDDADPAELTHLTAPPDAAALPGALARMARLLALVGQPGVPCLLVAAVAHAEIITTRPFGLGNGLVARALERVVVRVGGLDPTGVAVPEAGHARSAGADYRGALTAYQEGGPPGVRLWLMHCAAAIERGAREGERIADAVLAGRLGGSPDTPRPTPVKFA